MKKLSFILLLLVLVSGCRYKTGSGNIVTEKRNVGVFTGLHVAGGFEVELKNGSPGEVTVEADDNIMRYIETDVVDGELRVKTKSISMNDVHLKLYITAPLITKVTASAGAEVIVKGALKAMEPIHLTASSGSSINTGIDVPELYAASSSGGKLVIEGKTRDFHATASSGSSVEAYNLLSENGFASVSSGASIELHASVQLEATASSGGTVRYHGAATVKKTESAGGSVSKEG